MIIKSGIVRAGMKRTGSFIPKMLVRKFMADTPALFEGALETAVPETLGRVGSLEVRLARNTREIRKAQRLRYKVFYQEMSAIADAQTLATRRDTDPYDAFCDHLLVIDHDSPVRNKLGRQKPRIVGTYRLLRQDVANRHGGFYTSGEYNIQALIDANPDKRFLELGRSCVLQPYRNKKTVELLWHGIWSYVLAHKIDVMLGCASFETTNPDQIGEALSFLHHNAMAPDEWCVSAVSERYVSMNRLPKEALDQKNALRALPPLVKGYLRLGAHIGDGAVIDHQFGTTDVLIILPVTSLNSRYVNYYGADASRYSKQQ